MAAASPSPSERPGRGEHTPYLDNLATTPLDPRVLEAMWPYLTTRFGNPSSRTHEFGWSAAAAVDQARGQVAELIGATSREIVLTGGATEANNLAIKGVAEANRDRGDHLVTCVTEHRAVLDVFASLERRGFRVTRLPVDAAGSVDLEQLEEALSGEPVLLSLMAANNEIGTLAPLEEIGRLVSASGVIWHCDAAQAVGKVPVDVSELPVDLLSISAHKLYGPKGQGALFVRRRRPPLKLAPLIEGGGQERGLRSGTLNVPGIVGLGEACRLCAEEMCSEAVRIAALRDGLESRLVEALPGQVRHQRRSREASPRRLERLLPRCARKRSAPGPAGFGRLARDRPAPPGPPNPRTCSGRSAVTTLRRRPPCGSASDGSTRPPTSSTRRGERSSKRGVSAALRPPLARACGKRGGP